MKEYDLLCDPETEEEFQARMRADEERGYEDLLDAQEEYEDVIFDPEVDWNRGEAFAMSGPD